MDNTISKLLDIFKHIARDIIIYVIPGFLLIFNFYIIDKLYLKKDILAIFQGEYLLLVIFILSYILGNVIMAIMSLLYKILNCEEDKINFEDELNIYKKNSQLYEYFIERENQLYFFRWNLSGTFFISIILNIVLLFYFQLSIEFMIYFIFIYFFVGIVLLRLHYVTEKSYKDKIKIISKN